jgi:methylmalonyl-CoA mutase C-terminal domain/subunit
MARADEITAAAVEEDVDLVGLHVGGRIEVVERIVAALRQDRPDVPIIAGGTLSPRAVERLASIGVRAFPPGSRLEDILSSARELTGSEG